MVIVEKCFETGKLNLKHHILDQIKAENFIKKQNIKYAILRYFNVAGVEQN